MMNSKLNKMFDHIVIGAGASGCVLARRLIDGGKNVLLIEAGELHVNQSNVDNVEGFPNLWGSKFDWKYSTTPQKNLLNRVIDINQGKIVGGSSSINAMMYVRCNKADYKLLEKRGGKNWNKKSVENALSNIENYIDGPADGRYQSGLMKVRNCPDPSSYSSEFQQAAKALGYQADDWDYNGDKQENGAGPLQFNIDEEGNRNSAFKAYLFDVLSYKKLKILSSTKVVRVIIEEGVACGVEIQGNDQQTKIIKCKGKIILCSGALTSPLILERSGIGNANVLDNSNIPVKANLPAVGENLMDHLQLPVLYKLNKDLPNPSLLTGNVLFVNLNNNSPNGSPDLQLNFTPAAPKPLMRFLPPVGGAVMIFLPILVQPKSIGSIHIDKESYSLNPNYLSHDDDIKVLTKSIDLCQQLASKEGLKSLISESLLPDKKEYVNYIRANATTLWHPVGTCSIGKSPKDSVVDSDLQVHGVQNLHVADSSVTPYVTAGNNHVPTLVIGEIASKILLNDI